VETVHHGAADRRLALRGGDGRTQTQQGRLTPGEAAIPFDTGRFGTDALGRGVLRSIADGAGGMAPRFTIRTYDSPATCQATRFPAMAPAFRRE
jgi:hypothetical protein